MVPSSLQFGGAGTSDFVAFVEAGPGEEDHRAAVFELEAGLHGAVGDLAMAVGPMVMVAGTTRSR